MAEGAHLVQELGREVALHLPGLSHAGQLKACLATQLYSAAAQALAHLTTYFRKIVAAQQRAIAEQSPSSSNLDTPPARVQEVSGGQAGRTGATARFALPLLARNLLLAHVVVAKAAEAAGETVTAVQVLGQVRKSSLYVARVCVCVFRVLRRQCSFAVHNTLSRCFHCCITTYPLLPRCSPWPGLARGSSRLRDSLGMAGSPASHRLNARPATLHGRAATGVARSPPQSTGTA
eukprot:COSAG05_NODE_497_length_9246_cov_6.935343_11_plen_234_part_00